MRQVINKINEVDFKISRNGSISATSTSKSSPISKRRQRPNTHTTPRAVTAFMVDRIDPRPGELLLDPACGTGGFLTCAHPAHGQRTMLIRTEARARICKMRSARSKRSNFRICPRDEHVAARHRGPQLRTPRQYACAPADLLTNASDRVDIVLTNPPFGGTRGRRHREQLPETFSDHGNGGSVPRSHHPHPQTKWPCSRRLAGRDRLPSAKA